MINVLYHCVCISGSDGSLQKNCSTDNNSDLVRLPLGAILFIVLGQSFYAVYHRYKTTTTIGGPDSSAHSMSRGGLRDIHTVSIRRPHNVHTTSTIKSTSLSRGVHTAYKHTHRVSGIHVVSIQCARRVFHIHTLRCTHKNHARCK